MNSSSKTRFFPFLCDTDVPLPPHIPNPCTTRWLVTHYLDINSVPRRSFFELLWYHAGGEPDSDAELEKEKLAEFCTAQGQEELYNYCNRVKRNIREVRIPSTFVLRHQNIVDVFSLLSEIFFVITSPDSHKKPTYALIVTNK